MRHLLAQTLKKTPLYHPLYNWVVRKRQARELVEWERRGRPQPPPHIIKQRTIAAFAERYGTKVLVETGTYYGDMIQAMRDKFRRIYSIELSPELHRRAQWRFSGVAKIELLQGDSGVELAKVVRKLEEPALFWLDGHYSGGVTAKGEQDTPILQELEHIFGAPQRHVILIDDARCFGTEPSYPTIDELKRFIKVKRPDLEVAVEGDSIRITPPAAA